LLRVIYNKVVQYIAHKDVVVAENMGHKTDMVHKVTMVVENMGHNVVVGVENMVHKTGNMTHRTHIVFHNYFIVKNIMKFG